MQGNAVPVEQLMQEMEANIASLEEELQAAHLDKEEAISRAENLSSELEALTDELNVSNEELVTLREENLSLRLSLEKSEIYREKLRSSAKMLDEEKEDLALQLTDALLAMEEKKAIWSAKEKASLEAIELKAKMYTSKIAN